MNKHVYALKGDIVHSDKDGMIIVRNDQYLVCELGKVRGVYEALPAEYKDIPVEDKTGKLIIPGLVDLHLHAPQYAFRSLGMDLELLEWLESRAFKEEAKYADLDYARKAYSLFVMDLAKGATTRASIFATAHVPATLLLMDMLEDSGLITQVGKVNMDRNSAAELQEASAQASLEDTRRWLDACRGRYARTTPILTPRFTPSCSDELLEGLGHIQAQDKLGVQSHLSENLGEIQWVKELCPGVDTYADSYLRHGLLGGADCPTIMAHCVYTQGEELDLLKQQGVWVAHCPISNSCLSSGIAPVRSFMEKGVPVGLGTDIAGGYELSLFRVMASAIQDSKLRWRLEDSSQAPLTVQEVFYLATRGGGSYFGQVGAFDEGYEFDALVLDDRTLPCPFELTPLERLTRIIYLGSDANVMEKYVAGRRIK